jgi:multidrug resistance efflux pump
LAHRFRAAVAQAQAGEHVTQPSTSLRRTHEQITAARAVCAQGRADRKAFRAESETRRIEALRAAAARNPKPPAKRRHRRIPR